MAINSVFRERHKKIHLVGIGGIGMSGIARVLIASGFQVTGSDITDGPEVRSLRALGAQIFIGHHQSNVGDADVLVHSTAVDKDNEELVAARESKIPIIPRALMLSELMRLRCGIAVSGAHGKTTTTSLIGTLMHKLGFDPTIIIGGIVNHFDSNAVMGNSQFMVAEADESDGTFLHLSPTIAVVTNIDAEHLDFYRGGMAEIKESFRQFLNALPFYGLAVVCYDDIHVRSLMPTINRRMVTYGLMEGADYRASNIETKGFLTSFDLLVHEQFIGRYTVNMVGHHNVLNNLAAMAVLEEIGVAPRSLT
ncbi:MAG TPA: UDP-N-acetylmuramate--L-alanine ligase, partial [Myxococcota bacterium]|nr:UDP-N-acetylmuramate--L-alanine ligase [Myxococcota bacterium]